MPSKDGDGLTVRPPCTRPEITASGRDRLARTIECNGGHGDRMSEHHADLQPGHGLPHARRAIANCPRHEPASRAVHTVEDRKSTRLNSSHVAISYAVFC